MPPDVGFDSGRVRVMEGALVVAGGGITERDGAHAILSNAQTGFATGLDKLCAASKKYDYRNLTTILMVTSRTNVVSNTYRLRCDAVKFTFRQLKSHLLFALVSISLRFTNAQSNPPRSIAPP